MKLWLRILIAFLGSGINGALAYTSGQMPQWSIVFGAIVLAVSGTMSILISWPPPKTEA